MFVHVARKGNRSGCPRIHRGERLSHKWGAPLKKGTTGERLKDVLLLLIDGPTHVAPLGADIPLDGSHTSQGRALRPPCRPGRRACPCQVS